MLEANYSKTITSLKGVVREDEQQEGGRAAIRSRSSGGEEDAHRGGFENRGVG